MKALIVIPTADDVRKECMDSCKNQDYKNYEIMVARKKPVPKKAWIENIVDNRNAARKKALKTDADCFLWIDSDIVLPKNALSEMMKQPFAILGGWYKINRIDWNAGKWIADNTLFNLRAPEPSVIKVDKIDLGCIFMKREVLKKIKFRLENRALTIWGMKEKTGACECLMFAIDAQDAGYQLYMDGDVICKHLKKEFQDGENLKEHQEDK